MMTDETNNLSEPTKRMAEILGAEFKPYRQPAEMMTDELMAVAQGFWLDLCEKDDRTSPEEYPDMCLITQDELTQMLSYVRALSSPQPAEGEVERVAGVDTTGALTCSPEIAEAARKALVAWHALPEDQRSEDRPWIMGFNSGWEAATEASSVSPVAESARQKAIEAAAEIEMNREGTPYARTQEEFYADAAEMVEAILAALARPAELQDGLESVWQQARENHSNYSATGDSEQDIRFFALGLAGEAGEVANFVKKRWRDGDGHDEDLRKEVADVFAYNIMLADAIGMSPQDLIDMVAYKQAVFIEKMKARHAPETPGQAGAQGEGL